MKHATGFKQRVKPLSEYKRYTIMNNIAILVLQITIFNKLAVIFL